MRDFTCPNCGQHLAFENSQCLSCGSALGFSLHEGALLVIVPGEDSGHAGAVDDSRYRLCANLYAAECNWLVKADGGPREDELCASCQLTRTRPNDADTEAMAAFAVAGEGQAPPDRRTGGPQAADRRTQRGSQYGLAFDLLSSTHENVVTGHEDGVITVDLAEGDDVHREQLRIAMDEPYRTLLRHFRHEVAHSYFHRLIGSSAEFLARFRELLGDPDTDYQAALQRHYTNGPSGDWNDNYVSSYATAHPAEDWAESFAHYLHIRGTLDTAAAFGLAPAGATFERRVLGPSAFDTLIQMWLPLACGPATW